MGIAFRIFLSTSSLDLLKAEGQGKYSSPALST